MTAPVPAVPTRVRPDRARAVALEALAAVRERDAYANLVLPALLRQRRLAGRDAAFATELTYGTLRWRGLLDAVIDACTDRPLDRIDPLVLDLLRLGGHQLLHMRVPSHAAVGETVTLARSGMKSSAAGFVNAVLRKISRRELSDWIAAVAPDTAVDPIGHLSIACSHPRWMVEALQDALVVQAGVAADDLTELAALLDADNVPPRVTLVARPGFATVDELIGRGGKPGRFSPYAVVLPGGDPGDIPAIAQGRAGVQDEGSQLTALALAAAPVDGPDRRWLDLCAGPGGKAALLAALAVQREGVLTAVEISGHRTGLVREALKAVGAGVEIRNTDGREIGTSEPGAYDRVLLDAPCSGLGALRRRPESRWRRTSADLEELVVLQRQLLDSAMTSVRVGGLVAYVTCSPHVRETRDQVDSWLADATAAGPDALRATLVDARPLFPGVPDLGDGPTVQLWPHRHGTDAMFLALLRRDS
jgi:16S rRNA (cytosine967-C5)-methyltransferase